MLVSCTRAVWISEKMMQTSSSCKSLNCGSRRRSANSMYDRGIDSVIPSANLNNDESATVELCWRRPSGLTIDHKHRHRKKNMQISFSTICGITIKRTCILHAVNFKICLYTIFSRTHRRAVYHCIKKKKKGKSPYKHTQTTQNHATNNLARL